MSEKSYVGHHEAQPIHVDELLELVCGAPKSAGITALSEGSRDGRRASGKFANLGGIRTREPLAGQVRIGHNSWVTHGWPSDENAHRHSSGGVAAAHHCIIGNHIAGPVEPRAAGQIFASETPYLIFDALRAAGGELDAGVHAALSGVGGTYALLGRLGLDAQPGLPPAQASRRKFERLSRRRSDRRLRRVQVSFAREVPFLAPALSTRKPGCELRLK